MFQTNNQNDVLVNIEASRIEDNLRIQICPRCSMYGIFTYIYSKKLVTCRYRYHGWCAMWVFGVRVPLWNALPPDRKVQFALVTYQILPAFCYHTTSMYIPSRQINALHHSERDVAATQGTLDEIMTYFGPPSFRHPAIGCKTGYLKTPSVQFPTNLKFLLGLVYLKGFFLALWKVRPFLDPIPLESCVFTDFQMRR